MANRSKNFTRRYLVQADGPYYALHDVKTGRIVARFDAQIDSELADDIALMLNNREYHNGGSNERMEIARRAHYENGPPAPQHI